MVKHFGYCPSLRKKVDFEVSEVVDIPTKRGIKYQIKGNYEGRLCNTFCSASKAQELRTQIGSPKVFTVMEAEESQENLAQATQEESVPPIIGPSEKAYGQEGEAAQELPLAQTMPTPIISADDMSVQPIDDLSLPDATLADMQETLDVPPTMDADFEIAEIQPEGDGSSIGNIAPMNPDAPLHAEDFDAEESQENLGQATQEESVPSIIGPSQEAYGQEGEAAQELPLAETVPTPIISAVDMNVEPIDSLSSFNGGDILSQMESNLGERPEIMADFAIRPYQLFGQGRSIGNIAPMNPDVPFASEDDDDDDDDDYADSEEAKERRAFEERASFDPVGFREMYGVSPYWGDDDDFDAETLSSQEIEEMAQVPPPVCFAEKIPPSVWENTPLQEQLDYASSKNEGLLDCPQCGISKAELRSQGGYCGTTDPESEEYISSRSCPYEKYFAPQHWIDEPQVISHITPERIILEDTLMAEMDMPATDPIMAGVETRFIPKGLFYQINSMLPDGVVANQTIDGMGYELSYYGMDTEALDKIIDSQSQGYDIMFGAETFDAESKKKPSKTAEKAILTGASTGATMEIADALLAAEGERSFTLNYGPKRMYVVIEYNDGKELFIQDYKQFVEELNEAEATGDEELIESLFGVGSDYHNIAEEGFDMGGPNSTPHEAETFEAEGWTEKIGAGRKAYCGTCERLIQQSTRIYVNDSNGDIECADCYEYQQEAETFNAEETIFTQWVMDNYPHSYFSLIRERDRRNKDMDFAQWLMDTYPHIYFSYVEERMARDIGFEAETFEDCEVCYATVDKGTLNDVQAGRICNECHKMNQYEGGTKTIKTPYNAETFEANDAESFGAETIKTGVICGDNGCSGELLETEYGKASKVHCNKCDYSEIMEWDAETFEAGNGLGKNQRNLMQIIIQDYQRHSNQYAIVRVKTSKYCGGYTPQMIDSLYRKNMIKYLDNKGNPDIGFKEISLNPYQLSDCPTILVKPTNRALQMNAKDFDAETFGVEFDDWADQEMKSHGENVSFKKWAKEEGEKHGDVPLTDWAEHEEESHDERYGAEEYEILISDNNMDFGDSYNSFNEEQEALEEAWKLSQKETDMFVYVRRNDGKVIRVFRPNLGRGAENFESQSAQTKVKPPIKSIGILLGLGAIAAVVAPENLKKMFKR